MISGYKHKNPRKRLVEKFSREQLAELLYQRVVSRVAVDTATGCHVWTGARSDAGYGNLSVPVAAGERQRRVLVHRVVMSRELGRDLASTEDVCHRCDNPPCCNPEHLFLGTRSDNMRDALSKNRISGQKLSFEQARQIRERIGAGEKIVKLAREFRMSVSAVSRIKAKDSFAER